MLIQYRINGSLDVLGFVKEGDDYGEHGQVIARSVLTSLVSTSGLSCDEAISYGTGKSPI